MTFGELFRAKTPVIPRRGVHLDLKGLPPTPERLAGLLKVIAAARYNLLLVEWEDTFPWTVDKRFRGPTVYTPEEIGHFLGLCRDADIEVVPLVQCLGHMETPLGVPGYERLRELPDDPAGLNPLAPGARELVEAMVNDVLALMPGTRYFHLGGDEAWTLGRHPDTAEFIARHGKAALYLQHVRPLLERLNARGVRPFLWHDMMIGWEGEKLAEISVGADLVTWSYGPRPDDASGHCAVKYLERFRAHGLRLWGGAAYKGADGPDADLPDGARREANALAWVEIARRFNFEGVIATAWSRYSTDHVQCEPIDGALDSLVNAGVILHDGCPPEGGLGACAAALEETGDRARFEACRASLAELAEFRARGWQAVRLFRGRRALDLAGTRRNRPAAGRRAVEQLRAVIGQGERVSGEVRRALAGLVAPVWIEEYLLTRLQPLRDEIAALSAGEITGD